MRSSAQERKIGIYQILDNFIASSVAYNKCGSNDAGLKMKFGTNLNVISIRAAMQAKQDYPVQPEADLVKALDERGKTVRAKVLEEIDTKGCASDRITNLLKMYEFHANWNMYESKTH